MKAYSTRVGSGPYPTELHDEIGAGIAERGHEFGTVTGRPRRVGWFDAVPLRYAVAVNSVSSIMLNKLDILSGIPTIQLCVAYEVDGKRVDVWPSSGAALARAVPIYESFDGWARADPRRPLARRPARERPALRERHRIARRRPDRARVGRPGAHADDRTGLAPDAQPPGDRGVNLIMPTRILVVGGGGREHALAWKLAAEPGVNEVIVAPGSAGIATEPRVRCVAVDPLDGAAVVDVARASAVELVVIGPEAPLAAGVADALRDGRVRGLRTVGGGGADRVQQGVLPRVASRGRRPDGARRRVHGRRAGRCAFAADLAPRASRLRRQGGRARGRQGRHRLRRRGARPRRSRGAPGAAGGVSWSSRSASSVAR